MSRLYVFPSKVTLSTPEYTMSSACCSVGACAVTTRTRPPEETISSPDFKVPAWKTTTPCANVKLSFCGRERVTYPRVIRPHGFVYLSYSFQGTLEKQEPQTQHILVERQLGQNQDDVLHRPGTSGVLVDREGAYIERQTSNTAAKSTS